MPDPLEPSVAHLSIQLDMLSRCSTQSKCDVVVFEAIGRKAERQLSLVEFTFSTTQTLLFDWNAKLDFLLNS